MALLTTTSEQKTYKNVPLLHKNYFVLLCRTRRVTSGFSVERTDPEASTYSITVTEREPYDLIQKVWEDANS
jgi:hypothetical protein